MTIEYSMRSERETERGGRITKERGSMEEKSRIKQEEGEGRDE